MAWVLHGGDDVEVRNTGLGAAPALVPGATIGLYLDAGAATPVATPADVRVVGGGALTLPLSVDVYSQVPAFEARDDAELWYQINGGPVARLYPNLGPVVGSKVTKGELLVSVDDQPGGTDDAKVDAALAAVASGGQVRFGQARNYVLNADHDIPVDNITVTAAPWAVIKVGSARTGLVASNGRVFRLSGRTRVRFQDLTFKAPATPFPTIATESSVIYMADTVRCEVTACVFDLTGSVTEADIDTSKLNAVWVRGAAAKHNRIVGNQFLGAPVRYSYAGSSYTRCSDNTSLSSPSNAFTGTGNASDTAVYNVGCRVERNTILDPARMGVEDFSRCYRTVIAGNEIERSGTTAISAVSAAAQVSRNVVVDPGQYCLELSHKGERVVENELSYSTVVPTSDAVIVNASTATSTAPLGRIGTTLIGNTIHKAYYAITLTSATASGGALRNVTMTGNIITDWISHAVRAVNVGTTEAFLTMTGGNILRPTVPSTETRRGVAVGGLASLITGNQLVYAASAGGGTNQDYAVHVNGAMTLRQNLFDGGSITTPGPVLVSPISNSPAGWVNDGNTWKNGATYQLGTAVDPVSPSGGIARQTRTGNGAVTIDPLLGGHHEVTLSGNATSVTVTSTRLAPGMVLTVGFVQDATGGRTVAWPASFKFTGGAPPTAATANARAAVTVQYDGTNWNETGRYDPAGYPPTSGGGGGASNGTGVYAATTDVTVANSSAETVLDTYTFAAGTLVAGTVIRVRVAGNVSNIATSGTLTFRVRIGGLTGTLVNAGTATSAAAVGTNTSWRMDSQATVRTAGSSGSVAAESVFMGRLGANAQASVSELRSGTINTTVSNDLVVTAQWATADAGNTLTRLVCVVEVVKAV